MPGTGPARAIDCLPEPPGPNKCLPNGLRNPWLPYSGETYVPSSVNAINQQINAGSINGARSFGGRSVIAPSRGVASVIAPHSLSGSVMSYTSSTMGREEYGGGWGGSVEREHHGLEPDLTGVAGTLPIRPSSAWHYTASSPGNHAPLSHARFGGSAMGPVEYGQPEYRPRRASIRAAPVEDCADCQRTEGRYQHRQYPQHPSRRRSGSQPQSERERMAPMTGSLQSPYRKLMGDSPAQTRGSPLRPAQEPLRRKESTRSRRSSESHRPCSECDCGRGSPR